MKSKDADYNVRKMRTPPPSTAIAANILLVFPGCSQALSRSAQSTNLRDENIIRYNFLIRHPPTPVHFSLRQTENVAQPAVILFFPVKETP